MKRLPFFALLGALSVSAAAPARAGLPPGHRSSCGLSAPSTACHYRFRADGGLDVLTVAVTLRDVFDAPVPGCEASVTVNLLGPIPGGGDCGYIAAPGAALCSCCPLSQTAVSGLDGTFDVTFARLGGRGSAEVCVTAQCFGADPLEVCREELDFTSPDLDGTCETSGTSTSIIDFGIWAGCYGAGIECNASDYNCDCEVGVLDVAIYAGGLLLNCGGALCP